MDTKVQLYGQNEKLLICPYNPAHAIDPLRMAIHLIKCKKQYPHMEMTVCPFNATHHVLKENLSSHIRECKDKAIVDRALFIRSNPEILPLNPTSNEPVQSRETTSKDGENWDREIENSVSYNPLKNIIYKEVSRIPPSGLGKAGKRNWREVDCARIRRLREGLPIDDLVYPTPDGEGISIQEILSGPGMKFEDMEALKPKMKKSEVNDIGVLRRPKIGVNVFGNINSDRSLSSGMDSVSESSEMRNDMCSLQGLMRGSGRTINSFRKGFATPTSVKKENKSNFSDSSKSPNSENESNYKRENVRDKTYAETEKKTSHIKEENFKSRRVVSESEKEDSVSSHGSKIGDSSEGGSSSNTDEKNSSKSSNSLKLKNKSFSPSADTPAPRSLIENFKAKESKDGSAGSRKKVLKVNGSVEATRRMIMRSLLLKNESSQQ